MFLCGKNFFTNMGEFYLFAFELRCKHHDYKFLSLNSYTHLGLCVVYCLVCIVLFGW